MQARLFGKSILGALVAALVIMIVAACGDDTPTTPGTPPPTDTRVVKATPSLATDIQEIFNRK